MSNEVGPLFVLFCIFLTESFLILKLCNVINWPWWWITAPLWGPWALVIGLAILVFVLLVWPSGKKSK